MTTIRKTINLTRITFVVSTMIAITACTKETDKTPPTQVITPPPFSDSTATESDGKIEQLQREAQEGDPDAQYNLAYRYENGLDVPKNMTKALELYESAAGQGHSAAQTSLDTLKKTVK